MAGAQAIDHCERELDARIGGRAGDEYSPEDIAWYVALNPLPYGRLPGLDPHFFPIVEDGSADGLTPTLGERLSEDGVRKAERTNRLRALVMLLFSGTLCILGLLVLTSVKASALIWVNGGLVGVVVLYVGVGVYWIRSRASHVRTSSAFLPRDAEL